MNATVNLLDCRQEPTDAQLLSLMHSVGDEARAKAAAADLALQNTLREQVAVARARHLSLVTQDGPTPS